MSLGGALGEPTGSQHAARCEGKEIKENVNGCNVIHLAHGARALSAKRPPLVF